MNKQKARETRDTGTNCLSLSLLLISFPQLASDSPAAKVAHNTQHIMFSIENERHNPVVESFSTASDFTDDDDKDDS